VDNRWLLGNLGNLVGKLGNVIVYVWNIIVYMSIVYACRLLNT